MYGKYWGKLTYCQLNIQMVIMLSAIFFLNPGFHSGISPVVGEISVIENQKTNRAPNVFI